MNQLSKTPLHTKSLDFGFETLVVFFLVDFRESLGNPGGGSTWDKVGWWAGYTLVAGGCTLVAEGRVKLWSGIHLLGITV